MSVKPPTRHQRVKLKRKRNTDNFDLWKNILRTSKSVGEHYTVTFVKQI